MRRSLAGPLAVVASTGFARKFRFVGVRDRSSLYSVRVIETVSRSYTMTSTLDGATLFHAGPNAPELAAGHTAYVMLRACGATAIEADRWHGVFARRVIRGLNGDCWQLTGEQIVDFLRGYRRIADRPDLRTSTLRRVIPAGQHSSPKAAG